MNSDPLSTLEDEITEITLKEDDVSMLPSPFWNVVTLLAVFGMILCSWQVANKWTTPKLAVEVESSEKQIVLEDHSNNQPLVESEIIEVVEEAPKAILQQKKIRTVQRPKPTPEPKLAPEQIVETDPYNSGGELDLDNAKNRKKYAEATATPLSILEKPVKSPTETNRDNFIPFETPEKK